MADRIKLENIIEAGFDSEDGSAFLNVTMEYVCGECRHLVESLDKFCPFCGVSLIDTERVEHYYKGEQLTDAEFREELKQYGG